MNWCLEFSFQIYLFSRVRIAATRPNKASETEKPESSQIHYVPDAVDDFDEDDPDDDLDV